MKISDYIKLDTEKVYNNKKFKLYYDGYLTEVSNNEPVFLRYGDENWKNVKVVQMKKDKDNKLYANIKLNNYNQVNFCFEYNNVWDNNFSNNYSFEVSKYNPEKTKNNADPELSEYLSDEFLSSYNLIDNAFLSSNELEKLKETLDKLFPKDEVEHIAVQNITDNFVAIEYDDMDELEVYRPAVSYRAMLLNKVSNFENEFITNIVLEDEPVILKSNVQYAVVLRELAKKNEMQQILSLGSEDDAQFLVVSPYNDIDMYDNSFFGTIKRYAAYTTKSIKKVYYYLKENLSTDNVK